MDRFKLSRRYQENINWMVEIRAERNRLQEQIDALEEDNRDILVQLEEKPNLRLVKEQENSHE